MKKNPFKPDDMRKGASPKIFSNAKDLRDKATKVEEIMWLELRNNKFEGYKFRRRHPLLNYILLIFFFA